MEIPVKKGEKIGRNDKCPCGSTLKYKKCCWNRGLKIRKYPPDAFPEMKKECEEENKKNAILLNKIGYYLPHHQKFVHGMRIRSLYGRLLYRGFQETFHEFLIFALQQTLGMEWYEQQKSLSFTARHFILKCYQKYCEWLNKNVNKNEKLLKDQYFGQPDGYTAWLLCLAFDLYCLQHSKQLPEDLIRRLRTDGEESQGARYEIAIASIFARAGFSIEFINPRYAKKDQKTPDFIITLPDDGLKIVVEVRSKRRQGIYHAKGEELDEKHLRGNIRSLLSVAMKKEVGEDPYLIFIDVNAPITPNEPWQEKKWLKEVMIEAAKETKTGEPAKDTAIFYTNFSYHYQRDKNAMLGEYVFSLSLKPKHALAEKNWNRIIKTLDHYSRGVPDLDKVIKGDLSSQCHSSHFVP